MIADKFEQLINNAPGTVTFYRELDNAIANAVKVKDSLDETLQKLEFEDGSSLWVDQKDRTATQIIWP